MLFSVLMGQHPRLRAERIAEVGAGAEVQLKGNLMDRRFRVHKEPLRGLDAGFFYIITDGQAGFLPEPLGKILLGIIRPLCQRLHGQILVRVEKDVITGTLDVLALPGGKAALPHTLDEILVHIQIDYGELRYCFGTLGALDIAVPQRIGQFRGKAALDGRPRA